jgi:hypothetical protein
MKKLVAVMACALLVAAFPPEAQARMRITILEVTGALVGIDEKPTPNEITLKVGEEDAAGPLASGCRFLDARGHEIEQRVFVRNNLEKTVTVEIVEHTGEVISCRPGS